MESELFLFDGDEERGKAQTEPMSGSQRQAIRAAFEALGVVEAKAQFDLVLSLTGLVVRSPLDLNARQAQALLIQLRRRAQGGGQRSTGNAWADREEDTWIDKL